MHMEYVIMIDITNCQDTRTKVQTVRQVSTKKLKVKVLPSTGTQHILSPIGPSSGFVTFASLVAIYFFYFFSK